MITTKEVIIDNNQNEKLDGQNEGLLYVCQRNYFDLFYEKRFPGTGTMNLKSHT